VDVNANYPSLLSLRAIISHSLVSCLDLVGAATTAHGGAAAAPQPNQGSNPHLIQL